MAADWLRLRAFAAACFHRQSQQLALWIPVCFAGGIALWFSLNVMAQWQALLLGLGAIVLVGLALPGLGGRALAGAGLLAAAGLALIWARAEWVASPRIERPVTMQISGPVERAERLVGRGVVRVTLVDQHELKGVRARITIDEAHAPPLQPGNVVAARARLMPPPGAALPGGFDFARYAWFHGIGATGRAFGPVAVLASSQGHPFWTGLNALRDRLTRHIQQRLGGAEGGIAASFATGDQGGVDDDVAQALRDSGLTHLLSVSGLHIAAVVGFFMIATRKLLALSMRAATHWPLTLIGAGAGALAGVGYSLLAGGEVPTVRSCIAALLVLLGLALGREAITLRIVAAGAFLILLFRPEALVSASFQLSFAAVTAIVALHEWQPLRDRLMKREEPWWAAVIRSTTGLLLTGLVVEIALTPIGLYHFNRMGVYGAVANIIAIPLTTFIIMPVEAVALLIDPLGVAGPIWALLKACLALLIWIARFTAGLPGGVALAPAMPVAAFGLMVLGGLWLALWRGGLRLAGIAVIASGAALALATPAADIFVTGDGRHVGVRGTDGKVYLLRPRTGDFIRSVMSGKSAATGTAALDDSRFADCSRDACVAVVRQGGHAIRLLATRSTVFIDRKVFQPACAAADIVVSDRRLPYWCRPRWLKADRTFLMQTGGLAMDAASGRIVTVKGRDDHPWARHLADRKSHKSQ